MKHRILLFLLASASILLHAQDLDYARKIVDTLAHPDLHGRGYVEDGHTKAATFLANEWQRLGAQPLGTSFFQPFRIDVNTFPGGMAMEVNGQLLEPGKDYLVDPCASAYAGSGETVLVDPDDVLDQKQWVKELTRRRHRDAWLVVDETALTLDTKEKKEAYQLAKAIVKYSPEPVIQGLIVLQEKLTWHMSQEVCVGPILYVQKDSWPGDEPEIALQFEQQFRTNLTTQNVVAMIPGIREPDSFLLFTGHYDHLGRMGSDMYIPGANDNASGMALLTHLVQHYAQHPPEYTVVFLAFGAEEVGLLGSKYFVEQPMIELDRIRFLVNVDIVGTGSEGMAVVNGRVFEEEMALLDSLNTAMEALPHIKLRGKAANSDHYYFTEEGVHAFFIYTMGGISAYHDIYDKAETLPLTAFLDLKALLIAFGDRLMGVK